MPSVRRLLLLTLATLAAVPGMTHGPAVAQVPTQTVGIRIAEAPTDRAEDPRARQYIVDHLAPGTTITRRVEVSNDTAADQEIQLYAGAGSITDGSFRFGDGRAVNDLTGWTAIDPPALTLIPGAKSLATVTIAVPSDASPGERYAVVWAELPAAVPAGGGIAAVNRVGVRIYLSVGPGGEPASDFAITAFDARRDADSSPVVAATVDNTGGRALDLSGELNLSDGPGGLKAGPFEAKLGTTLGIGQAEPVLVVLDKAIPAGEWDARMVLRSGTTEREATARITIPAAGGPSGPVEAVTEDDPGDGGSLLPVLIGIALLLGVLVLLFLLFRRRSSREHKVESAPPA